MFPVRHFRRAGAFRGAPLLVAASACFLILATASASAAPGTGPHRDHGRGHWFKQSCAAAPTGFARCDAQVVTNAAGSPLAAGAPPASALGPAQFAGAYSLPTSAPSSATIAIVDAYDNPNIESDLAAFDSYYGLPACTTANGCFRKVNQIGGTSYPAKNTGWGLEIALDVETAHEICQSCKILLVEAISPSFANLGAAENEAVALGASVVSNSWGGAESSTESSLDTLLQPPRRGHHRIYRRLRLRRAVPGGLAVRGRRRRDDAQPQRRQQLQERARPGAVRAPGAPRTRRSRLRRPATAAPGARSPTSRPTPIRTAAPRSTTRTATPAGSRSAARRSPRR